MRRGSLHAACQQITALLLLPLSLSSWCGMRRAPISGGRPCWIPRTGFSSASLWGLRPAMPLLEVVFEDYLQGSPLKKGLLLGSRAGLFLSALLALVALLV